MIKLKLNLNPIMLSTVSVLILTSPSTESMENLESRVLVMVWWERQGEESCLSILDMVLFSSSLIQGHLAL